jgi:hypothetical protein
MPLQVIVIKGTRVLMRTTTGTTLGMTTTTITPNFRKRPPPEVRGRPWSAQ